MTPKLPLLSGLLVIACLALAGCDSLADVTDRVREKLSAHDEPRTRDYPAATRATYEAVRIAADQMGFRFLRGGAAQGEFEAINGVGQGDVPGSARQVSMKVHLHANPDGGTELTVTMKEIIEADSTNHTGVATETPLRDTPLYDTFLRAVEKALQEKKTDG